MINKQPQKTTDNTIRKGNVRTKSYQNQSPFQDEKVLIVQRDIFTSSPFINSLFAKIIYLKAETFQDLEELENYLLLEKINRIVFSNPYRSERINNIYEFCRKTNFPILVIERGCLPGTVFFDMGGFLLDSPSYKREAWDSAPTKDQENQLNQYISTYHQGLPALEAQSTEEHAIADLKKKLQTKNKPVVLITLQMPSDTVTRFFAHHGRDYASFIELMNHAASQLNDDYTFIYKPHPRTPELKIDNAKNASNIHIDQLMELADAVMTFNSGTGVLAFLHDKPVATYGQAFYGGEGLTQKITNLDDISFFLGNLQVSFNSESRKRFLIHLLVRQLSVVRFLTFPFWKKGTPIAIQFKTIRFYDFNCAQKGTSLVPEASDLRVYGLQNCLNIYWATKRWIKNRIDFF